LIFFGEQIMNASIECPQCETLGVFAGKDTVNVKIPRIIHEGHYLNTLDQLLKLRSEHSPATWVFDVSELDGIPIALASILLGFGEQARDLGWEVRFTGIRNNLLPFMPRTKEWVQCFGAVMAVREHDCELTIQSL
jgi:hypothetical protein